MIATSTAHLLRVAWLVLLIAVVWAAWRSD